jgi:membrane associated rhomboid family serine protease
MSDSTALQVLLAAPFNTCLLVLIGAIYFYCWDKRVTYEHVATSYQKVVTEKQYYRIITSAFCHANVLHLVFNMSSLYEFGSKVEQMFGFFIYFRITIILLVFSQVVFMVITFGVCRFAPALRTYMTESSVIGYSGVIYGLMTFVMLYSPDFTVMVFNVSIPIVVTPFLQLIINQVLVPRASILGHFSGIISGLLIGVTGFSWINTYWFLTSFVYLVFFILISVKSNSNSSNFITRNITLSPQFLANTDGHLGTTDRDRASLESSRGATASGRYMDQGGVLRVMPSIAIIPSEIDESDGEEEEDDDDLEVAVPLPQRNTYSTRDTQSV